ncbi:hypothetical protein BRADI_1g24450v3 [Brachypodium distachyon]|uniref:Uncharacterized protein n=1 Tax=Brachypodium distachyon TaxID=15368 RepID=A0A0Q3KWZ7_BRADI|nr:hypothetical protein BRADI_1g24450v3 [Brachypodium distachyon]
MGKKGKAAARERREQRRAEVTLLRAVPYEPHQRWWDLMAPALARAVAVVTGASRGIGREIARQLALDGLHVVLASRDAACGREAAEKLVEEAAAAGGASVAVEWRQLDVADAASVEAFAAWTARTHGGIHVLLLKPSPYGGRIVNVSSRLGRVNGRCNRIGDASLKEQLLTDDRLSEELIDGMVTEFVEQVKQDSWSPVDWPQMYTDYSVSKLAVNAYTRLMARRLLDRPEGQKIFINCFCPGWVKTAMTGWEGNISAEEGADTGVWLALLPQEQATIGKFFAERREMSF